MPFFIFGVIIASLSVDRLHQDIIVDCIFMCLVRLEALELSASGHGSLIYGILCLSGLHLIHIQLLFDCHTSNEFRWASHHWLHLVLSADLSRRQGRTARWVTLISAAGHINGILHLRVQTSNRVVSWECQVIVMILITCSFLETLLCWVLACAWCT